ncbi:MAG TPA: TrbG/VirB9 family P-type conjugative transfer protein, partial [Terricaulis sp.]|nr:TrbG/VirB9 family P-type conjugative transfer protein [Terricaulis sp.]
MKRAALLCLALTGLTCASADAQSSRAAAPIAALAEANAEARRRPDPANFTDATQIYDYAPGAIYEVYGAPGYISTVLLEPGETIVTVAAGDTTRWMVEQAVGGDIANARAMLLIKPTRASIRTNIVLVTDRRTYAIEAIATAGQTYSAQTAWRYPAAPDRALAGAPVPVETLNFAYRIRTVRGFNPRWRPVRVFDDGA